MSTRGAFGSRRGRDLQLSNFLSLPVRILVVAALLAAILFPLYWLASNSLKEEQEYYHSPPIMFPTKITGQNFVDIVVNRGLFPGLKNSLLIATFTTLVTVLFGSLASYSLVNGMLPRRIKRAFAWWFLIQKMYPAIVIAVPVFYIIRSLRLMDRVAATLRPRSKSRACWMARTSCSASSTSPRRW
jgi:multiple sugar transport system permease protein